MKKMDSQKNLLKEKREMEEYLEKKRKERWKKPIYTRKGKTRLGRRPQINLRRATMGLLR